MLKVETFFKEERDPFFKRGKNQGIQEGIEQTLYTTIKNLIVQLNFTDKQAAEFTGKPVSYVKKVRAELKRKGQL